MSEDQDPKVKFDGEVEVLDDLTELLTKAYKKRMIQLRLEMKKILEDSVGRK